MKEKYKNLNIFKQPHSMIYTNSDLYKTIEENITLSDELLFFNIKKLVPYGTSDDFLKNSIKTIKRKIKISRLLDE